MRTDHCIATLRRRTLGRKLAVCLTLELFQRASSANRSWANTGTNSSKSLIEIHGVKARKHGQWGGFVRYRPQT
jgi:hypothetical protein